MRTLFRDYLRLGRGERSGFLALFTLLLLLFVYRFWLAEVLFKPDTAFLASIQLGPDESISGNAQVKAPVLLHHFDPNTAPADTLVAAGLPGYLAGRIIKYREAGGRFNNPDDLGRIYGLDDSLLQQLMPYISIAPSEQKTAYFSKHRAQNTRAFQSEVSAGKKPYTPQVINLAEADSALLTTLPGIGPVLSSRILRYATKLGGITSAAQLMEVYGIDSSLVERIRPYLIFPDTPAVKINLNLADFRQLRNHPYIGYRLAGVIVNYRSQHGRFSSAEDLKKIHLVSDSVYKKISPYLTVN